MKKIFIGLILVFLDLTLTIGKSKIGLIPDFLGYIIILSTFGKSIYFCNCSEPSKFDEGMPRMLVF